MVATQEDVVNETKKGGGSAGRQRGKARSDRPIVAGVDIGYSNVKLAWGPSGKAPKTRSLPANAGPREMMPTGIGGLQDGSGQIARVTIDGQPWVAFAKPGELQAGERPLFEDYPSTPEYRALFLGALLVMGMDELDLLVTGLPVNQAQDAAIVDRLRKQLSGEHQVSKTRTVNVKDVMVVAQPTGTYYHAITHLGRQKAFARVMAEGRCAVVDSGSYTTDWVVVYENAIRQASSGSSRQAMSVVYETIHNLIADDHGIGPGVAKIERAISSGSSDVMVGGEIVDFSGHLVTAAQKVAGAAMTAMRKHLRLDSDGGIDLIVLTGGGAPVFEPVVTASFPDCRNVWVPEDASLANAQGYWGIGDARIRS